MPAPEIPAGHWMAKLRAVEAADLFCQNGLDLGGSGPPGSGLVKERFLYYDGVVPAPQGIRASVAANGTVTLTGAKDFDAADVRVIDRRGDRLRVARLAALKAGAEAKPEFADTDPAAEAKRLTESLTAAGLNADEAGSVTEIWRKESSTRRECSWFTGCRRRCTTACCR
jgi:hypothetical protein